MSPIKLLLSFLIFCSAIEAQNKILNLLNGKWKLKTNSFEAYEEWKVKDETEIAGISYSIEDGEQKKNEDLFIKKVGEFWAYIAAPKNQNPALFYLTSFKDNRFIFENPEHDFPNKIIYHFTDRKTIAVTVEGEDDDGPQKIEFTFIKVE